MIHLPIFTNSEIETWRRCQRLHWYKYHLLYRERKVDDARQVGSLIHAALEAWFLAFREHQKKKNWKRDGAWHAMFDAMLAFRVEQKERGTEVHPLRAVQAQQLMMGYHCRWADAPGRVLEVESEFRMPGDGPFEMGGKIDVLYEIDGDVFVMEHKSTASDFSLGSFYWERTRLSPQVGLYFSAVQAAGKNPRGIVYDVIGKPRPLEPLFATPPEKRKYTKAGVLYKGQSIEDEEPEVYRERLLTSIRTEPGAFYSRQPVVRLQTEVDELKRDLTATAEMMSYALERGMAPRNSDSCFDFARRCEFYPVCAGQDSLDNAEIYERVDRKHVELDK